MRKFKVLKLPNVSESASPIFYKRKRYTKVLFNKMFFFPKNGGKRFALAWALRAHTHFFGKSIKQQDADVDLSALHEGIKDALSTKQQLSDADLQDAMRSLEASIKEKQKKRLVNMRVNNLEESVAFLAKNKKKKGIKVSKTGLQYKVHKKGSGKAPKASDTCCHTHGT